MTDIISTSDGKISFKKSEYKSHNLNKSSTFGNYELTVWTDTWEGGRITKYTLEDEAQKASQEIIEQLKK